MAIALALHGGAGTINKQTITAEQESAYKAALQEALDLGWRVLENGGTAIDAVKATVIYLEDCPLFNAGKGAVYTHDGTHELDAALMDGATGQAGAIAGVKHIKNPILGAEAVMKHTDHVLLVGDGAETVARKAGLQMVSTDYYGTEFRKTQLEHALREGKMILDHDGKTSADPIDPNKKYGTVGAVALDQHGNLAAATSTGGMTNKKFNRVGDSPIVGAGTWADKQVAISATGHGEIFIANVVAYDVAARMKYLGQTLEQATNATINEHLASVAPDSGGIISVDNQGNVSLPFNTEGMYRAWRTKTYTNQSEGVAIYKD